MPDIAKKLLLSVLVTVVTLGLGLIGLRLLAPQLLPGSAHAPADIRLVQVDEAVPPFFELLFNREDPTQATELSGLEVFYRDHRIYLPDPHLIHRPIPMLEDMGYKGPHDAIGFRNLGVPNRADVITLGDSQTYGANARFPEIWPSQLRPLLSHRGVTPELYNVSIGGWCGVHYYYLFEKLLAFEPKVVVVAHYMGNDALEAFRLVYANPYFHDLIPDDSLSQDDLPPLDNLAHWETTFADETTHVFTAERRLLVNAENPVVDAGYAIMGEISRRISALAAQHNVAIVYTIIPTHELVYQKKVARDGLDAPQAYRDLVRLEQQRIDSLAALLDSLPESRYVDILTPLQQAALTPERIYRFDSPDGHPFPAGYGIIADTLAPAVRGALGLDASEKGLAATSPAAMLHLPLDDNTPSALVAEAKREELGQTFLDASGNPHTSRHAIPGVIGGALAFDGMDDAIQIPKEQVAHFFAENADFTMAFWWRSDSDPFPDGYRAILRNRSEVRGGLILFQRGNSAGTSQRIYLNFYLPGEGPPVLAAATDGPENMGTWHHYVFQREGTTLRAWRDGKILKTYTDGSATQRLGAGEHLLLGSTTPGAPGAFDDFRLYARALSESEIVLLASRP